MRAGAVAFDFPAKSGVRRTLEIDDPAVVTSVRSLMRRNCPSDRFLVVQGTGGWKDVHADDLNARFKELLGATTASRTSGRGTEPCSRQRLSSTPTRPVSKKVVKRVESAVMKEVSEGLGNTPAVARSSYVDPRVVTRLRSRA